MSALSVAIIIFAVIAVPLLIIGAVKTFRRGSRLKEPSRHPGQPGHVRCPECGERNAGNAVFCEKCGHRLRGEPGTHA